MDVKEWRKQLEKQEGDARRREMRERIATAILAQLATPVVSEKGDWVWPTKDVGSAMADIAVHWATALVGALDGLHSVIEDR